MSVYPNTFIESFLTRSKSNVKDIWSEPTRNTTDEINKDLYMNLSIQAAEIAALTKMCENFKGDIDQTNSLKSEIIVLNETCEKLTKELSDVKKEMSSLLTGEFYIHSGGSPHGISPGIFNKKISLLSQDHMINQFAAYDVASDGTVKCDKGNGYPLSQRWSFERATDKLIRHPNGDIISIPLDK